MNCGAEGPSLSGVGVASAVSAVMPVSWPMPKGAPSATGTVGEAVGDLRAEGKTEGGGEKDGEREKGTVALGDCETAGAACPVAPDTALPSSPPPHQPPLPSAISEPMTRTAIPTAIPPKGR